MYRVALSLLVAVAVFSHGTPAQQVGDPTESRGPRFLLATAERSRPVPVDLRRSAVLRRPLSLAFDGAPLGDVVRTLGRWYNVEIRLADSALAARRLTASFQNEPIDLVLHRIALTLGLRVERAGGAALLLRNGS